MLKNRLLRRVRCALEKVERGKFEVKREAGLQQDIKSSESTWHGKARTGLYYPLLFVSFLSPSVS